MCEHNSNVKAYCAYCRVTELTDQLTNIRTFINTFDMSEYEDADKCFQKGFQRALDRVLEALDGEQ